MIHVSQETEMTVLAQASGLIDRWLARILQMIDAFFVRESLTCM
jgi:hypothetical protein